MDTKDTLSKLTEPTAATGELDDATLDQVSGGAFLRGGLYAAMQTGGVELARSYGTNATETPTTLITCPDPKTYFSA